MTGHEPRFVDKDEIKAVGMKCDASMEDKSAIPKLWDSFLGKKKEIKNKTNECCLGICVDWDDGNDAEDFSYMAAVPVENFKSVPKGMEKFTLPKSRYAVFTHKGKLDKLDGTYDFIYKKWLPESGKEVDYDGFVFELYDSRFTGDDKSEFDIYIPIV